MQDARKMKEAETNSRIERNSSKALYHNMLKILERYLQGKLEGKPAKFLNTEIEKRLDMMRNLKVQNSGIGNLEFQEINCRDFKFLNENEIQNQMYSNIKQKNACEAINFLHLPVEDEFYRQSDDKNGVSTSVTDEFFSMLSEACKDKSDVHFIPSMSFNKMVAARLVLFDKFKTKNASDEGTLSEKMKERSNPFDVKMESCISSNVAVEGNAEVVVKLNQPQKENDELSQSTQADSRKLKPGWLETFIKRTFFVPCPEHPIRRNELNKYCIDCDKSLCQYCVSLASHSGHRMLKIYRHVYKDVVPLDEIERRIDCSKIQPYRCNRQMVIALTPLPHSGSKTNEEALCQTCRRRLIEHDVYSYCSISCKAVAYLKKKNDADPPFLLLDKAEEVAEQVRAPPALRAPPASPVPPETIKTLTRSRKRKGIPHRAPLF